MRKYLWQGLLIALLFNVPATSFAQTSEEDAEEQYVKQHVALSRFQWLGVNTRQYAKCVESVNYLESDKKIRRTIIDEIEFSDNGKAYDLVSGDGIMTSAQLFEYAPGVIPLGAGEYRLMTNEVMIDPAFVHADLLESGGTLGRTIAVTCLITWVKCTSWPREYQDLCRRLCWPFKGTIQISGCHTGAGW